MQDRENVKKEGEKCGVNATASCKRVHWTTLGHVPENDFKLLCQHKIKKKKEKKDEIKTDYMSSRITLPDSCTSTVLLKWFL